MEPMKPTTEELAEILDLASGESNRQGAHAIAVALQQAAARLRELDDATRWRPIEEAPKDGTEVLVYDRNYGGPCLATWEEYTEKVGAWVDEELRALPDPTHFMPLPETPGKEDEK